MSGFWMEVDGVTIHVNGDDTPEVREAMVALTRAARKRIRQPDTEGRPDPLRAIRERAARSVVWSRPEAVVPKYVSDALFHAVRDRARLLDIIDGADTGTGEGAGEGQP